MSSKYNDLKTDIKCWERMFERQHKRKPNKVDIKSAPPEIQKCYKDYMSLKKEKSLTASNGIDVFGVHLNKPTMLIEKTEQKENLVPLKPNLRKKFDIKKSKAKQVAENSAEASLINSFGLDSFVSSSENKTHAPILPSKSNSFFTQKGSDILKKLEKQTDTGLSFHEVRSKKLLLSPNEQNVDLQSENVLGLKNPLRWVESSLADEIPIGVANVTANDNSFAVFELSEDNQHNYPSTNNQKSHSSGVIRREETGFDPTLESNLSINEDLLNQEQVILFLFCP